MARGLQKGPLQKRHMAEMGRGLLRSGQGAAGIG